MIYYILAVLVLVIGLCIWLYVDVRKHPAQHKRQKGIEDWCEGCSFGIDAVELPTFLQNPLCIPEEEPLPTSGRITELEFISYKHDPIMPPPIHIYDVGMHRPTHPQRAIDYRDGHGHFIKKYLAVALHEYGTFRDIDYIMVDCQCYVLHNYTRYKH